MNQTTIDIPSIEEARELLEEASRLNPGPWVEHSLFTGMAAAAIAEHDKELDKDTALVLGMLHDIGRRFGITGPRHSLDGYRFALDKGYNLLARICMTHSLPYNHIDGVCSPWDCTEEEMEFVRNFFKDIQYTAYDKLIQLCDALALSTRLCIIEERLVDVAMRYGFNEHTIPRWKVYFEIQSFFEERIGKSIYSVLPNVAENITKK